MNSDQIHILRHSLGLTRGTTEYRNHFVAGGKDIKACRDLTAAGMMEEHPPREVSGGSPFFTVTEAGKQAARAHSPKPPSRGRRRWLYWLSVADCFPDAKFGDFLTRPEFADVRASADGMEVAS